MFGEPVSHRGDSAQVFKDVLLADEAHGNYAAGRIHECRVDEGLQQENALGMMPEGPMPEVCQVLLTGVDRQVKRQTVHWFAAVLPGLKRHSRA